MREDSRFTDEKKEILYELKERVKELKIFYGLGKIIEKPGITLDGVFKETANLLPAGWSRPDNARVRILFREQEFTSRDFKKGRWKQSADIFMHGRKTGIIEVYYLEEMPQNYEGPFLKGERELIGGVAERKKGEEDVKRAEKEWEDTFNAISDIVFIVDTDYTVRKVNRAVTEALKLEKKKIIGRKCYEVLHKRAAPWPACPHKKTLADNKPHTREVDDPNFGMPLLVTTSPIQDDNGKIRGTVHIAKDISGLRKDRWELERRIRDLEIFRKAVVDREMKMIELKKRVEELEEKLRGKA